MKALIPAKSLLPRSQWRVRQRLNCRAVLREKKGLAGTSKGFITTFGAVDQNNITSVFARRVGP
jgi:hypothetical protein